MSVLTMVAPRALVLDFDGTIALTFEPGPNGIGVQEAYKHAVQETFGPRALVEYENTGGLRNRAPREVVLQLQKARLRYNEDPATLTHELVRSKIACLVGEIGKLLQDDAIWPRLTPGFKEFWVAVKARGVFTAIVSSGHRAFIEMVFEVYDLELPDIMLTDDELRALPEPLAKPDARLWNELEKVAKRTLRHAVYIGDCADKDGGLARNAGVSFLRIVPADSSLSVRPGTFSDWRAVPALLAAL